MTRYGRDCLMSVTLLCLLVSMTVADDITGAGATLPAPLYAKWAEVYKQATGIGLHYQSIGSEGGIKQIKEKTVDFGASDKPLTLDELQEGGLLQFPTVMSGVVLVMNLEGVKPGDLHLTGQIVADIYLGKITQWNAPAIAQLNKDIRLAARDIAVVHRSVGYRSAGSGTTFIFTNYLSKVSPEWKEKVGNDATVPWPTGLGGKGNAGVASYVQRIPGAIGYVEYAYAVQNEMAYVSLQNHDGVWVKPDAKSFQAAAAHADWAKAPGFYEILTNEPGKESWPITGATFIVMHKTPANPEAAKRGLAFFKWAYEHGDKMAVDLGYIPIPDQVVQLIYQAWTAIQGPDGKPVY
jgi:phosphate transport system substrate-binding protein